MSLHRRNFHAAREGQATEHADISPSETPQLAGQGVALASYNPPLTGAALAVG